MNDQEHECEGHAAQTWLRMIDEQDKLTDDDLPSDTSIGAAV